MSEQPEKEAKIDYSKWGFIVTSVGTVTTSIISLINIGNKTITSLSLIFLITSLILLIIAVILFYRKKQILFYSDRSKAPDSFKNNAILKYIANNKYNICVAGRTNLSWLTDKDIDVKKILYEDALKNECKIKFIIQHDYVKNSSITDNIKIKEINDELKQTKRNFENIHDYLKDKKISNLKENFKLLLTSVPVNNSITDIYKGDYHHYFSFDIGLNIKKNPFLVFRKNSALDELKAQLFEIEERSVDLFDYNKRLMQASDEIDSLTEKYSQFSGQRDNHNKKLVYHYFERKRCLDNKEFYPPVSIQLLITNECTAQCVMCTHYSINSQNELSSIEIEHVFDYINDLGTKNIIISGGEPLARKKCIPILESAKNKKLNVGLLTNGIKYNNESLTLEDAERIKNSCEWVQLSIDSFNPDTYKKIRKVNFDIVKQSLSNLEAAGVNIEIAFTIQKLNIEEAISMIKGEANINTSTKIRFKFAHGPNNNNDFLLSTKNIELKKFITHCNDKINFNTKYISEMFAKNYFNEKDIIDGNPLYSKNKVFKDNGSICHALNYSCKIDAQGNLYPCCFLFDDNVGGTSEIRKRYNLGSLRRNGSSVAPFDKNKKNNRLKELLSVKIDSFKKDEIPLEEKACNNCTRHFYQNAFLNELDKIASEYKDVIFKYPEEECDYSKIWI